MTDSDGSPFYTSEDPSLGTHEGWIVDPAKAQEVANLEAVARNREEVLLEEHNTGLTEKERRNQEILDVLVEEFPYAFNECTDEHTGEKYYKTGISALPYAERTELEVSRADEEYHRLQDKLETRFRQDFQMKGLLDTSKTSFGSKDEQACITKDGIQFEGRHSNRSISFEDLIPERQKLFLEILKFLNDRGEVINKHLEEEKAKVTAEGLRERIRAMKNNKSEN